MFVHSGNILVLVLCVTLAHGINIDAVYPWHCYSATMLLGLLS